MKRIVIIFISFCSTIINCFYIHPINILSMSLFVFLSVTLITLALVFYSTGIWVERFARYLKGWPVAAYWSGSTLAYTHSYYMATYVVRKGSENLRIKFHRYSIVVWLNRLIPYFGGMMMGMKK
jgi:hypothetical protein